jgi:hypothetical protein
MKVMSKILSAVSFANILYLALLYAQAKIISTRRSDQS